jgi:hypothetical protein
LENGYLEDPEGDDNIKIYLREIGCEDEGGTGFGVNIRVILPE